MEQTIICVVKTPAQAETIVMRLQQAGLSSADISVLMPDRSGSRDFGYEHNTKAPEGATLGVGAGGVAGGVLGLLAGIGALAIPGVGPLIAAGPIMATLSGAAIGATLGGIAGALVGFGMPEQEARQYESKVMDGGILISAHVYGREEVDDIERILQVAGAEDIAVTGDDDVIHSGSPVKMRRSSDRPGIYKNH